MDQRKQQRVPLSFPLQLRIGDIDRFVEEHAINLSEGGIFVKMNYPPPVGSKVLVDFFLESVKKTIRAEGEVVHSVSEGARGDSPVGMGIRFTELSEDGQRFIDLSVQKFHRKHPSMFLEVPEGFIEKVDAEIQAAPDPMKAPDKITLDFLFRSQGEEKVESRRGHTLRGGELFISSDNPTPVGETVELQVFLRQEERWTSATGEVVRHVYSDGADGCPAGPGIAVVILEPSDRIKRLFETAESESKSVQA